MGLLERVTFFLQGKGERRGKFISNWLVAHETGLNSLQGNTSDSFSSDQIWWSLLVAGSHLTLRLGKGLGSFLWGLVLSEPWLCGLYRRRWVCCCLTGLAEFKCLIHLLVIASLLHKGYCWAEQSLAWLHRCTCNMHLLTVGQTRENEPEDMFTHSRECQGPPAGLDKLGDIVKDKVIPTDQWSPGICIVWSLARGGLHQICIAEHIWALVGHLQLLHYHCFPHQSHADQD